MKEITKNETKIIKKSIYVADDGTEFNSHDKCELYEANCILKKANSLFNIKYDIFYDGAYWTSIEYHKEHHDLFIKTLQILAHSQIDNKQVDYFIDDSNIRRENFDCQIDKINKYKYIDGETYLLRFKHREESDTYDFYGIFLEDCESMKSDIMSLIKNYNQIFNTEFKL